MYLINAHNGYQAKNSHHSVNAQKISPIDINNYPAIKAHLDQFEPALSKRADKGKTPYNLRNCAYLEEFEKEKVVYSEIVRDPRFYMDKSGAFFVEATSFLMTGKNLKYITGLLNSKFITYAYKNYYAGGGLGESGYRYKKAFLENLPIPTLDTPQKQQIAGQVEQLVEEILKIKQKGESKEGKEGNTEHLEKQIDELVFDLYGLSPQERRLVSG